MYTVQYIIRKKFATNSKKRKISVKVFTGELHQHTVRQRFLKIELTIQEKICIGSLKFMLYRDFFNRKQIHHLFFSLHYRINLLHAYCSF